MALDGTLAAAASDDAVAFTFVVTNAGDEAVELEFRNGLAADFVVLDGETAVWRWSDGRMFTQALWSEPLAPDGSVTYEAAWEASDPGAYEALATLEASNADVAARTSFEV